MSASSSRLKMATPEPDKGRKDYGSPDNTSTDGTSFTSGSREDDSVAMSEDLNIFQAILLNNFEVVEHLLDTSRTDYIVHIKATDSLGRYVFATTHSTIVKCNLWSTHSLSPKSVLLDSILLSQP